MRIGFVSVIREAWGGSEELWAAAAHELLEGGHEVVISAMNTGSVSLKMDVLLAKKARILYRRGFIQPGADFKQRVFKKIRNYTINLINNPYTKFFDAKPDIIVYTGAGDAFTYDPYFLKLLYSAGVPLVFINQGYYEYTRSFDSHESEILKKAFDYTATNLFVSNRNQAVMERFLAAKIKNAAIVRNPVNLKNIELVPYPASSGTVQFAILGNLLVNHKGQDIVLEVLSQAKWKERNWQLNIFGSGVDEQYLRQLTVFFDLGKKIKFHGKVENIRQVWSDNHILLMPSRFEGIPLVVVEAMLCGRPVVATDVGGHTEWINEGIEGFIAEAANVNSFENAMERAWNASDMWEQIGTNAHTRAKAQYDPDPGKTLASIILKSKSN